MEGITSRISAKVSQLEISLGFSEECLATILPAIKRHSLIESAEEELAGSLIRSAMAENGFLPIYDPILRRLNLDRAREEVFSTMSTEQVEERLLAIMASAECTRRLVLLMIERLVGARILGIEEIRGLRQCMDRFFSQHADVPKNYELLEILETAYVAMLSAGPVFSAPLRPMVPAVNPQEDREKWADETVSPPAPISESNGDGQEKETAGECVVGEGAEESGAPEDSFPQPAKTGVDTSSSADRPTIEDSQVPPIEWGQGNGGTGKAGDDEDGSDDTDDSGDDPGDYKPDDGEED